MKLHVGNFETLNTHFLEKQTLQLYALSSKPLDFVLKFGEEIIYNAEKTHGMLQGITLLRFWVKK